MNDNAKAWVAALRSGEYAQGEGALKDDDDRYCCLGVACEVYRASGKRLGLKKYHGEEGYNWYYHLGRDASDTQLPECVRKWLGVATTDGDFGDSTLIDENDNGMPFAEIADIIESLPSGLFVEDA